MELYEGRPDSVAGRMEKEIKVYDLLDSLGIEYQRVDHPAENSVLSAPDARRESV